MGQRTNGSVPRRSSTAQRGNEGRRRCRPITACTVTGDGATSGTAPGCRCSPPHFSASLFSFFLISVPFCIFPVRDFISHFPVRDFISHFYIGHDRARALSLTRKMSARRQARTRRAQPRPWTGAVVIATRSEGEGSWNAIKSIPRDRVIAG